MKHVLMTVFFVGMIGLSLYSPACVTPKPSEEVSGEATPDAVSDTTADSPQPDTHEATVEKPVDTMTDQAPPDSGEPQEPAGDAGEVTPEPVQESPADMPDSPDVTDAGEVPPEGTQDEVSPDVGPGCKSAGEVVATGEQCCSGLTKSGFYADALCMPPATFQVCTQCGDGVCDYMKGEDQCSCPKDCKQAAATGACYPKQKHLFTCPDGKQVPWCECSGKAPCIPECKFVGTRSEGWYSGCDDSLIKYEFCSKCKGTPICDKIGTRSEGWYCDNNLIAFDQCAKPTGSWSCIKSPENGCTRCSSDKDCKLSACSQFGSICVEWRETCGGFQLCQRNKTLHPKKTCNVSSGTCQ